MFLLGKSPSLAPADLFQSDFEFTTDSRRVSAGVLKVWLETKSLLVFGRNLDRLAVA